MFDSYHHYWKIIIIVFFVFVSLVCLLFNKQIRQKNFYFWRPGSYFLRQGDKFSIFFKGLFNSSQLRKENIILRNENRNLTSQLVHWRDVQQENNFLRKALNINLEKKFNLILTRIEGEDISQGNIIIDKGTVDGLYPGLPVINSDKVLLGRISRVFNSYSIVQFITSRQLSFSVEILDKNYQDKTLAIIYGRGDNQLEIKMIPYDKKINLGDLVISSYMNKNIPEGLLIGKIVKINKSATASFQTAVVKPFIDMSSVKNLFVIVNY